MDNARCATVSDRGIFFDETRPSLVRSAKKICSACPVKTPCLDHAIKNKEVGVWGETTTNQRTKMVRSQRVIINRINKRTDTVQM